MSTSEHKIPSEASQKRFPIDLCTKNATCRISKQRSLQHQAIPLQPPQSAPRDLRVETGCLPIKLSATRATPPLSRALEETPDEKVQDTGPSIAEVHIRGMISMSPDPCILPYIEKP